MYTGHTGKEIYNSVAYIKIAILRGELSPLARMRDNSHTKSRMFQRDGIYYIYLFEYIHTCMYTHIYMYTYCW